MKTFERITIHLIKWCLSIFGQRKCDRVLSAISVALAPIKSLATENGAIKIVCTSKKTLYWIKNFYTHEPETIKWIRSFKPGEVFWDIGANVGIYSLYAADIKGVSVVSFEPMSESYATLQKNIFINAKEKQIAAFCLAFSDKKSICQLELNDVVAGSDSHRFIPPGTSNNLDQTIQNIISISIDEFVQEFSPLMPTHIKIDVDGPEAEILKGAKKILQDPSLKSLLIEGDVSDTDKNRLIFSLLESAGFVCTSKGSTAGSSIHCNYIFSR